VRFKNALGLIIVTLKSLLCYIFKLVDDSCG
jgi:hypothetical protein